MDNYNFSLTPQAEQDLREIWLYISQDSISAAEKVANDLEKSFAKLSLYPKIGRQRDDLLDIAVRFWVVHNYYVIYNPDTNPLQILRVMSSYRDIKNNY